MQMAEPASRHLAEGEQYNIRAVCDLIRAAFTPDDLWRFCRDRPVFAELLNLFEPDSSLERMIDRIYEFCQTRLLFGDLLREIEAHRPRQYALFRPKLLALVRDTDVASQAIDHFTRQLNRPEWRDPIVAFRAVFETACERICRLGEYKQLHEWFHRLSDLHNIISSEVSDDGQRLKTDKRAWARLMRHEPDVQELVGNLLDAAQGEGSVVARTFWIRWLEPVPEELRQAIERLDPDRLESAVGHLGRVLDRAPSQINDRLHEAAMSLQLAGLAESMGSVRDTLPQPDLRTEIVQEITAGVNTLRELGGRLVALVEQHNLWQELHNQLNWIEANLGDDMQSLRDAWPDLQVQGEEIYGHNPADWAVELRRTTAELQDSLATGDSLRVRMLFLRYRSQAGRQFSSVDQDLLGLCCDLQDVGKSLDDLTEAMPHD
jgi:hypothetical protein